MNFAKWIFAAACTLTLTACPGPMADKSKSRETEKFSGVWVRANEYCDYMRSGYGPTDYRCEDIDWEDNRSYMAMDDAWLVIVIGREGDINNFSIYSDVSSDEERGLGRVTPQGYYMGYLNTMNDSSTFETIRINVDGEFMFAYTDGGRYRSLVRFLKLTPDDARDFEAAYNECGSNSYCKGSNSPNEQLRKAKTERDNDRSRQAKRDRNNSENIDTEKFDLCIARGETPAKCAKLASKG